VTAEHLARRIHRLCRYYLRSIRLDLDEVTASPNNGPKYDQAYLDELKASTPSTRPSTKNIIPTNDEHGPFMEIDVEMGLDSDFYKILSSSDWTHRGHHDCNSLRVVYQNSKRATRANSQD